MAYELIYGPQYAEPLGFIVERGEGDGFRHRFGGASWAVSDHDVACGGPTLLLTLDLRDERLSALPADKLDELPLCSYINGSGFHKEQVYQIVPDERAVRLVRREEKTPRCPENPEYATPTLLDEIALTLRPMAPGEYAIDNDCWWTARGSFLGEPGAAGGFLRILGTPFFCEDAVEAHCDCGREMEYVAAVGQEKFQGGAFLNGSTFFIGEGALYFFLCPYCLRLHVHGCST